MELKKRVSTFLKSEKGGLSKKALIDGAVAAGIVFALAQTASAGWKHTNEASVKVSCEPSAPNCTTGKVSATHSNHSNHSNHGNY